MIYDRQGDGQHAWRHEILDADSGQPITSDLIFYADDEAGFYRRYVLDERGCHTRDPATGLMAWEQVPARIRIAPRNPESIRDEEHREDVSLFFSLSYASYLVLPRLVMEGMPGTWQEKFVALLNECGDRFGHAYGSNQYKVKLRDGHGGFGADPLADYRRGRIPPKPEAN